MKRLTWQLARAKCDAAPGCRVCGRNGHLDAAHVIGRRVDHGEVDPSRIVPLCRRDHDLYDSHRLDLLPYLTVAEQARAVLDAGGIDLARRRIVGRHQMEQVA